PVEHHQDRAAVRRETLREGGVIERTIAVVVRQLNLVGDDRRTADRVHEDRGARALIRTVTAGDLRGHVDDRHVDAAVREASEGMDALLETRSGVGAGWTA